MEWSFTPKVARKPFAWGSLHDTCTEGRLTCPGCRPQSGRMGSDGEMEIVSVELQRSTIGFGMTFESSGRISGFTDERDGSPGPAELAGVAEVMGGKVRAVNGEEVTGRPGASRLRSLQTLLANVTNTPIELLIEVPHPLWATFSQFRGARNKEEYLGREELHEMLNSVFDADMDYVDGLLESFGEQTNDTDYRGQSLRLLPFDSFPNMWEFLGQPVPEGSGGSSGGGDAELVCEEPGAAAGVVAGAGKGGLLDQHDLNGDGMLNMPELEQMILSTGYEVDAEYTKKVMEQYGTDGKYGFGVYPPEFSELCAFLDEDDKSATVHPEEDAVDAEIDTAEWEGGEEDYSFERFDVNGDGLLDSTELFHMMEVLNFDGTW